MGLNSRVKPEGNLIGSFLTGQNGAPDSPLVALTDAAGNVYKVTDNGDGTCTIATTAAQVATGTPITASSGNVANASAVATLAAAAGKTTYINGFILTASGATAGLPVVRDGGHHGDALVHLHLPCWGAGRGIPAQRPLLPAQPLPASAVNTAIVVTLPAGGSGNTNAAADAYGFQL